MTAEIDKKECSGVRSWIKEIHNRRAVICASATTDTLQERNINITLHYLINGRKDACPNVTCPVGQECVVNLYCIDTYDLVGGHGSVTYNNTCQFYRTLQNGTSTNRSYLHLGKCKSKRLNQIFFACISYYI